VVGGIGSGKSFVARLFAEHGGRVIDADGLGHEALRQPAIRDQVIARWGHGVLNPDGSINRRQLGRIVFTNPAEKEALERLVFPWIEQRIKEEVAAADRDPAAQFVVLDAAIMMETGWDRVCDRIAFVDTPEPVRLARLAATRGWTASDLHQREATQWPLDKKEARAHFVIDNAGDEPATRRQIGELVAQLTRAAGA
jgi:dephospho-CoA kinase